MNSVELEDFKTHLPDMMPVSVVMEKTPSRHQWIDFSFKAAGVVTAQQFSERNITTISKQDDVEQFLCSGLSLQLHADQCESYYHNLMSPQPGCYVVAEQAENPGEMPVPPYLVSLSFDEAQAYLEGDEQVYSVAIPAELYQWCEAYILTHYIAIKKTKRKLKDWKQDGNSAPASKPS